MSQPETTTPPAPTSPAPATGLPVPVLLAFLALPAAAYAVGVVSLPRPQSVQATRSNTTARKELQTGQVLLAQAPTPKLPTQGNFGNKITVLGLDLDTATASLGSRVNMTFYFRAEAEMQETWKVFLHVDSQTGQYRIHGDHFPPEGYGTEKWRKGDTIADRYSLWVPLDAHKGSYDIWMGFYDPNNDDDRLQLQANPAITTDGSNRLKLGTLVVN